MRAKWEQDAFFHLQKEKPRVKFLEYAPDIFSKMGIHVILQACFFMESVIKTRFREHKRAKNREARRFIHHKTPERVNYL